jgi:hypothetical protein
MFLIMPTSRRLPSAQTSLRRSNFQSNPQSYDNKEGRFCKEKIGLAVYNCGNIMDNPLGHGRAKK